METCPHYHVKDKYTMTEEKTVKYFCFCGEYFEDKPEFVRHTAIVHHEPEPHQITDEEKAKRDFLVERKKVERQIESIAEFAPTMNDSTFTNVILQLGANAVELRQKWLQIVANGGLRE